MVNTFSKITMMKMTCMMCMCCDVIVVQRNWP